MKCKLLRDEMVRNQKITKAERNALVQKLIAGKITRKQMSEQLSQLAKAGTVIDHPRAFRLVQLGVAEPADNECTFAADMSDSKIAAAFESQTRTRTAQLLDPASNGTKAGVKATAEKMKKRAAGK